MASLLESGRAYGEWLCGEWWGLSDFHVVLLYSLCSNEMKWSETVLKISLQHPEIKNMSEGRQGVFGRKTEAWPKFIYSEGILKTAHEARSLVQTVLKEQFNIFTRGFKIWSKNISNVIFHTWKATCSSMSYFNLAMVRKEEHRDLWVSAGQTHTRKCPSKINYWMLQYDIFQPSFFIRYSEIFKVDSRSWDRILICFEFICYTFSLPISK